MRIWLRPVVVGAALACLLSACTIPGNGLLGPAAQRPSPATVQTAEAETGRVPLVTIPASAGPSDYVSALAGAVQAAEAQKPDVVFDVLSAVPQTGTPLGQITQARGLTPDAAEVATSIMGDGVPVARITLGAMVVPGLGADEVRVYVR
jgi:hypothetical protein